MRKTFADLTREMAEKAAKRSTATWWVYLDEPTTTLFATTDDNAHASLASVLYADRMPAHVAKTDKPGVACIRTETPICVLAVAEESMKTIMRTIRSNNLHGMYRKAGTRKEYRF